MKSVNLVVIQTGRYFFLLDTYFELSLGFTFLLQDFYERKLSEVI